MDPLELDGSILEGGGQVLRNTVSYCCLLGKNVKISEIRLKRDKPGLKAQHLHGLRLVAELCDGKLSGDTIGSTEIAFLPQKLKGGDFSVDPGTAGSITVLMQVSLPCMLFSPSQSRVTYKGGTNAEMAPQVDFTTQVFHPTAHRFGADFTIDIVKRGFYPKGGGEVVMVCQPIKQLHPITMLDKGHVTAITGRSFVSGVLPPHIATDMAKSATAVITAYFGQHTGHPKPTVNIDIVRETEQTAVGNGCGLILLAHTSTGCILAGSAIGSRGVPAKKVGKEAGEMLVSNLRHGGCVDEHLQDQIIILMALADGKSAVRTGPLTLHTETAIHFAQQVSGARFTVTKADDHSGGEDSYIIECEGIGYKNPYLV